MGQRVGMFIPPLWLTLASTAAIEGMFETAAHAEASGTAPTSQASIQAISAGATTKFAQFGVGITGEFVATAGAMCPAGETCVLGSGGGIAARLGYRWARRWYLGGAYEVTKHDSSNLYRFATLQQLRGEYRLYYTSDYAARPFVTAGGGYVTYGEQWGFEANGASLFIGVGIERELSPSSVISGIFAYRPMYFAPFNVSSVGLRDTSIAHVFCLELALDVVEPL